MLNVDHRMSNNEGKTFAASILGRQTPSQIVDQRSLIDIILLN